MFLLSNLTNQPNQTTTAILADGSTVTLKFIYRPAVQRWTIDVLWKDFDAKAIGLATNPNLLQIWDNVIPFGLQVDIANGTDPFMADDLASGRVKIYVLDSTAGGTDLADVEAASFT